MVLCTELMFPAVCAGESQGRDLSEPHSQALTLVPPAWCSVSFLGLDLSTLQARPCV